MHKLMYQRMYFLLGNRHPKTPVYLQLHLDIIENETDKAQGKLPLASMHIP